MPACPSLNILFYFNSSYFLVWYGQTYCCVEYDAFHIKWLIAICLVHSGIWTQFRAISKKVTTIPTANCSDFFESKIVLRFLWLCVIHSFRNFIHNVEWMQVHCAALTITTHCGSVFCWFKKRKKKRFHSLSWIMTEIVYDERARASVLALLLDSLSFLRSMLLNQLILLALCTYWHKARPTNNKNLLN